MNPLPSITYSVVQTINKNTLYRYSITVYFFKYRDCCMVSEEMAIFIQLIVIISKLQRNCISRSFLDNKCIVFDA